MKLIYRLLASVLVLFTAAACYNEEIENPDDSRYPDQPQMSELRITASIVKTRVSYSDAVETDDLILSWQKGDILFGYIGQIKSNTVTLTVDEVDEGGVASLKAEGENLTKLLATTDGDFVDLIYTGSAPNSEALASETYIVDMTTQTPNGKIPACMHARGIVKESNGSKSLNFNFQNDCAIIEILGVTGPREDEEFSGGPLTSISITNLPLAGNYSYSAANGFSFVGTNAVSEITLDDVLGSGWTIGSDGRISNTDSGKRILIAVAPCSSAHEQGIKISAVTATKTFEHTYFGKIFEHDICYVIHDKDVVARVGNEYFTTVTDAFNKANIVYNTPGNTITPTVVLLRDCGLAGVNKDGTSSIYGQIPISIDSYDVTFDLNGHTLTLAKNEHFDVSSGKKFIIKDSSDPSTGLIQSNYTDGDGYHIIYNNGIVTIDGGQLRHNFDWSVVDNDGELYVNDGVLFSDDWHTIQNGGTVLIEGGTVYSRYHNAISDYGTSLIINGGELYSVDNYAIKSDEGASITIVEAGKEDECYPLIYTVAENKASIIVNGAETGTQFIMRNGLVYSNFGAVDLQGNVSGEISGGQLEGDTYCALAIGNGADITVSGGHFFIKEDGINNSAAVRAYDQYGPNSSLTIKWGDNDEPVIYANGSKNVSIDARFGQINYAKLYFKGGYYYSKSNIYFYYEERDKPNTADSYNLQTTDFGDFYSNQCKMMLDSNISQVFSLDNNSFNNKVANPLTDTKQVDVTFHKIAEGVDGTYALIEDNTETLVFNYHITAPVTQQPSGTQSYQFGGFSW